MDSAPLYDASRHARAGRGQVYDSILDTIGNTPLVRLPRLTAALKPRGEVLAKLEFFNPMASVKDRIGLAMIEFLEQQGLLKPGSTIVEPTSGNTGIALAFVAAARGLSLILVMPESMSIERRKMLLLLGARLELTPAERGMSGAVARARELLSEIPGSVMPQQWQARTALPSAQTNLTQRLRRRRGFSWRTSMIFMKSSSRMMRSNWKPALPSVVQIRCASMRPTTGRRTMIRSPRVRPGASVAMKPCAERLITSRCTSPSRRCSPITR